MCENTIVSNPINITVNLQDDIFVPTLKGDGSQISNMNASNLAFGVVRSSLIYGNTLSNISASNIVGTVPSAVFGNAFVSNTISTPNLLVTSNIGFSSATGTGGTGTQLTSRNTGVTVNKPCGQITLFTTTILAQATNTFTLTNSYVGANDFVLVNHISGQTPGSYTISVNPATGSADITMRNVTTATLASGAPILQFVVIKAAIA